MRLHHLFEGGWNTTATQSTVITPAVVRSSLTAMNQFIREFNRWLKTKNLPEVKMGRPTGSSAYHAVDPHDKIYGDIDLQMIAPQIEPGSHSAYGGFWNKLAHSFIMETSPDYVHPTESKIGHPILRIGADQFVQIDFMWHTPELSAWGAARVTPERGVKGLLFGKMFSVFGDLLGMSIQHAGVQYKTVNGERVPFSKQKGVEINTLSSNPKTYIVDILRWIAARQGVQRVKIDPMLAQNSGTDIDDVRIQRLVRGVKGFAISAEANGLFGQGDLANYSSADDFITKFVHQYRAEADAEIASTKRDKAETPAAIARADADREKIRTGLDTVMGYFREGIELEEDWPKWFATGLGAAAMATGMAHRQGPAYDKPQPYVAPVAQVAPAQRPQTAPAQVPQAKVAPAAKAEPVKAEPKAVEKPQVKNKPITLENPKANVLAQRAQKSGIKGIELAQFLAQMEHESWDFKKMKEVPQGKDYFKRYDPKHAPKTAQKLGNVKAGDGERFKGRGFIQLTGRDNYRAASQALGIDLLKNPDLAARPDVAAEIAIWYWFERVRPGVMDFANTVAVTKRINPALAGIEDRHENFKYYLKYMR